MSAVERAREFLEAFSKTYGSLEEEYLDQVAVARPVYDRASDEAKPLTVADLKDLIEKAALVDTVDAAIAAATAEGRPEPESTSRWVYAVQRHHRNGEPFSYLVPLAVSSEQRVRDHARRWEDDSATVVRRVALTTYGPWEPAP